MDYDFDALDAKRKADYLKSDKNAAKKKEAVNWLTARFPTLPETPEGKVLVGVELRLVEEGDTYFHPTFGRWETKCPPRGLYTVAIFADAEEGMAEVSCSQCGCDFTMPGRKYGFSHCENHREPTWSWNEETHTIRFYFEVVGIAEDKDGEPVLVGCVITFEGCSKHPSDEENRTFVRATEKQGIHSLPVKAITPEEYGKAGYDE